GSGGTVASGARPSRRALTAPSGTPGGGSVQFSRRHGGREAICSFPGRRVRVNERRSTMAASFVEPRRDIAHIGPVELFTPKLEATRDFFVNLMALREVHRDDRSVFLHTWDDYQRYSIRLIERDDAGIGRTFLRAASPQAFERVVERLDASGRGRGYSDDEFALGPVYLF